MDVALVLRQRLEQLDLSGNVVGILTFKFKGGENLNFAVSINALKPLLVSTSKPLPLSSLTASPTDLSDKEALSKSYWKAAATALSSIQDWRDKAFTAFTSSDYSNGEVYINRTAADRASDALTKAKLDVKLAKAEVSVPADKQVQDRLEIYLDAAETMGQGQIHLDRSVISDDLTSKLAGCRAALEAVLDAGSNKTFSEHPNMCPAH